jgi:hypothetical protein
MATKKAATESTETKVSVIPPEQKLGKIKIDMSVSTDDLVNVHVAQLEAQLLNKQQQYRNELVAARKSAEDAKKACITPALNAALVLVGKIPSELNLTFKVPTAKDNAVSIVDGQVLVTINIGDRSSFQQPVTIDSTLLTDLSTANVKVDELTAKLSRVCSEISMMPARERQVRAELSRRKLEQVEGTEALLQLSSTNPMLSLPADL